MGEEEEGGCRERERREWEVKGRGGIRSIRRREASPDLCRSEGSAKGGGLRGPLVPTKCAGRGL